MKPVNMEGLTKWVGQIPPDVVRDMPDLAPMLEKLGYDPRANPPNYGNPDNFVLKNEEFIRQHKDLLDEKVKEVFGDKGVDLENNPAADENHPLMRQPGDRPRPMQRKERGTDQNPRERPRERPEPERGQGPLLGNLKNKMNKFGKRKEGVALR